MTTKAVLTIRELQDMTLFSLLAIDLVLMHIKDLKQHEQRLLKSRRLVLLELSEELMRREERGVVGWKIANDIQEKTK
jgi:hypothetical protein